MSVIQQGDRSCEEFGKLYRRISIAKCVACRNKTEHDECRFINMRMFRIELRKAPCSWLQYHGNPSQEVALYPWVFNRKHTIEMVNVNSVAIARMLLCDLQAELSTIESKEHVYRPREVDYRVSCDGCHSQLFRASRMCNECGREYCYQCVEQSITCGCSSANTASSFYAITRFQKEELKTAIQRMQTILHYSAVVDIIPAFQMPVTGHLSIEYRELTSQKFEQIWAHSVPFVVTNATVDYQIPWTPSFFASRFGSFKCVLEDCAEQVTVESTVSEFFKGFGKTNRERALRLKDWPPTHKFQDMFGELYEDFILNVPVPDYTSPKGVMNLASRFPLNSVRPDLGPKMYNAHGSPPGRPHCGSTRLHVDMTDAINILLYAEVQSDGSPGGAIWHIFRAEDAPCIREYLRKQLRTPSRIRSDPIHDQQSYLGASDLEELAKLGLVPYTIFQRQGQAVFIPSGCPHQVQNITDCMKIASDFLSPQHLWRTEKVAQELREHRLIMDGDDVLQLQTSLWYCWNSLEAIRHLLHSEASNDPIETPVAPAVSPYECPVCSFVSQCLDDFLSHFESYHSLPLSQSERRLLFG